jgi:hypothetical protein
VANFLFPSHRFQLSQGLIDQILLILCVQISSDDLGRDVRRQIGGLFIDLTDRLGFGRLDLLAALGPLGFSVGLASASTPSAPPTMPSRSWTASASFTP